MYSTKVTDPLPKSGWLMVCKISSCESDFKSGAKKCAKLDTRTRREGESGEEEFIKYGKSKMLNNALER